MKVKVTVKAYLKVQNMYMQSKRKKKEMTDKLKDEKVKKSRNLGASPPEVNISHNDGHSSPIMKIINVHQALTVVGRLAPLTLG